ncbi:MAG: glycerate kinase [Bacteriovoracia bacterium]
MTETGLAEPVDRTIESIVAAIHPRALFHEHVKLVGSRLYFGGDVVELVHFRSIWVIGAGKASAAMAQALEGILGDRITGGVVIVNEGNEAPTRRVQVLTGTHPFLSERNLEASQALIQCLRGSTADDLVITVFSGGGSALFEELDINVELADYLREMEQLYRTGIGIHAINRWRKRDSLVKGGKLLGRFHPALWLNFLLSDVPGDELGTIASGPTVPREGEASSEPVISYLLGGHESALRSTSAVFRARGFSVEVAPFDLNLPVETATEKFAAWIREFGDRPAPRALVASGELLIDVRGPGHGGRNQHLALSVLRELRDLDGNFGFLALGTDGRDGPTDAAGGLITGRTAAMVRARRFDLTAALAKFDAYSALQEFGALVVTGPTGTNVGDLAVAWVLPADG